MVVRPAELYHVPGVAVFDSLLRVISAEDYHTPDSQCVTERLHRLGYALADPHALAQRADDLMGIGLFQLVIADIFTDKIVDVFFLLPWGELRSWPGQPLHPGGHGLLVLPNAPFVKQVFRLNDQIGRVRIIAIGKAGRPENIRVIQTEPEKYLTQLPPVQPGHHNAVCQTPDALLHRPVGGLFTFCHLCVVIGFHSPAPHFFAVFIINNIRRHSNQFTIDLPDFSFTMVTASHPADNGAGRY